MALSDYRPMMERCSNCLGCKWIPLDKVKSMRFGESCPSVCYYNFHSYSARGKFQLAQTLLDGDCSYSAEVTASVHNCLSCGACDIGCKICRYNLEPLEHNIAFKADAIEQGHQLPAQAAIMQALAEQQTMLSGRKKAQRTEWAAGLDLIDVFSAEAEILFFPGCKYSYEEGLRDSVRNMVGLLHQAGVAVGYLGQGDTCCAGRAWQMGFFEPLQKKAAAHIKAAQQYRVQAIVTPCADCYHAFKRLYAAQGLATPVLHITEYVANLLAAGRLHLRTSLPLHVTYHDPCHLGRLGEPYVAWQGQERKIRKQIHTWDPPRPRYNGIYGVYEAPRQILAAINGIKLTEMERIREYSWCCGAGAACNETVPELSAFTANERLCEARASGAEALVSACPWCKGNLSAARDEAGQAMPVYDLLELVQQAL